MVLSIVLFSLIAQSEASEQAVERARALLVEEHGLEGADLTVDGVVSTEFPDTSLGCPEEGVLYAPVMLSGYVVELRAGDSEAYEIHVSGEQAVWCERPAEVRARDVPRERESLLQRIGRARTDLAERLGVEESAIRLRDVTPSVWPDSSLGCPEIVEPYEEREISGHRIDLVYHGEVYTYHAGDGRIAFCSEIRDPL